METFMDIIGGTCLVLMVIAPIVIFFLIWKFLDGTRMVKIAAWLLLSAALSYMLYGIGLAIIFRHGMGPV